MVIGAFLISRIAAVRANQDDGLARRPVLRPADRQRVESPLWAVLALWTLAGAGGAYQFAAAAVFVQALHPDTRARAFGVAQSGLSAVQGLGILAGGAVAQLIGSPLAMSWTHLRGRLIQAPNGPESPRPAD